MVVGFQGLSRSVAASMARSTGGFQTSVWEARRAAQRPSGAVKTVSRMVLARGASLGDNGTMAGTNAKLMAAVTPVPSLRRNRPRAARRAKPYARRLPRGRKASAPGEIVQLDTFIVSYVLN